MHARRILLIPVVAALLLAVSCSGKGEPSGSTGSVGTSSSTAAASTTTTTASPSGTGTTAAPRQTTTTARPQGPGNPSITTPPSAEITLKEGQGWAAEGHELVIKPLGVQSFRDKLTICDASLKEGAKVIAPDTIAPDALSQCLVDQVRFHISLADATGTTQDDARTLKMITVSGAPGSPEQLLKRVQESRANMTHCLTFEEQEGPKYFVGLRPCS